MELIRLNIGVPLVTWKSLRDRAEAEKLPGKKSSVEAVARAILIAAVSPDSEPNRAN